MTDEITKGIICGLVGVVFLTINALFYRKWRAFTHRVIIAKSPYCLPILLGFLTAVVTFPKFIGQFASVCSLCLYVCGCV